MRHSSMAEQQKEGVRREEEDVFFQLLSFKILVLLITSCRHYALGAGKGLDILLKHDSKLDGSPKWTNPEPFGWESKT